MSQVTWQVVIVLVLTLLNGFFVCSEIALISVRKTLIANLVKQGSRRAKIVEELRADPERLFATLQVGISIITVLTSAFAGTSFADRLGAYLEQVPVPFIAAHAYGLGFAIVVALVAYVNLILGELVPKSLGLRYGETFALAAAYPVWWLSKISRLAIRFLSISSNLILRLFRDSTTFMESRLSEEEIRTLLTEGKKTGAIEPGEHSMIENVFEFSDLTVGKVMVPRTRITALDIDEPVEDIVREAIESRYSRIPIYRETLNNIVGILYTKELLKVLGEDVSEIQLGKFLLEPLFVPNTMKISQVLERLKRKKIHMALVTDEHGEIEGLVTLEDLLEEIVGDIADETDEATRSIVHQADGSWIVLGEVSIVDLNRHFGSELPENEDFSTVSGFILDKLGRFPELGDTVTFGDLDLIVEEKTDRMVKTVKVRQILSAAHPGA